MTAREPVREAVGRTGADFLRHWRDLLSRTGSEAGWSGIFWERDPRGMRACLDGAETPPWDVAASLLQDLAALLGPGLAGQYGERLRHCYTAALAARDALPGAAGELAALVGPLADEEREAARRVRQVEQAAHGVPPGTERAEALALDLAWARDDLARAGARRVETETRLARVTAGTVPGGTRAAQAATPEPAPPLAPDAPSRTAPPPEQRRDAPPRRSRPRGARFAGIDDALLEPAAPVPPMAEPATPRAAGSSPRGARFAGGARDGRTAPAPAADPAAQRACDDLLARLAELRRQGRGGEAHLLLVGAAHGEPNGLPLLAEALGGAGLGADWSTVLWEAAALPVPRLVDLAGALEAYGRERDAGQLLRQGVVRPVPEMAEALLVLGADGREGAARSLAVACVRARTPEDSARLAGAAPGPLVPLLLDAARTVSAQRHGDLVHALRVAGIPAG